MQRFIIFYLLISFTNFFAQSYPPGMYSSSNKKAIKYFEESKKMFQYHKDEEAEKLIKKAIEEDGLFIEALSAYADFMMGKNKINPVINAFGLFLY